MARVGKRPIADSHFIVSTSKVSFYVDQLILGIIIREGLLNNWKQEFRSFSICNKNEGGIIKMAVVWKIVWRAKKCEINKGSHNKHTVLGMGWGLKKNATHPHLFKRQNEPCMKTWRASVQQQNQWKHKHPRNLWFNIWSCRFLQTFKQGKRNLGMESVNLGNLTNIKNIKDTKKMLLLNTNEAFSQNSVAFNIFAIREF